VPPRASDLALGAVWRCPVSTLRVLPALFVLSSLVAGCAAKAPDPFKVPRSQFDGIRTVAVADVGLPVEVREPEAVKSRIADLLAEELMAAGFNVVPRAEVKRVAAAIREAAGPIYDPVTGKPDSAKVAAMEEAFRAAVRDSLGADAFLDPDVVVERAPFAGGKARWDGTSQTVQGLGSQMLMAVVGLEKKGVVPALSVCIKVMDEPNGTLLYHHHGGLEVLADHALRQVAASELFADDSRTVNAVTLALAPLRGRGVR
jgi:hypothetical protein